MSIKINIPLFMQDAANGVRVAEVKGSTIGECLNDLVRQFPRVKEALFDKDGNLHYHLTIWINRESTPPDVLAKPIEDRAELDIIRLYMGG